MQAPQPAWDSDVVLTAYLKQETEPTPDNLVPEIEAARLALTKIHLNDLRDVSQQTSPRPCELLDVEKAGASFRFKVLAWKTFPINRLPIEVLQYIFRLIIRPRTNYRNIDNYRVSITSVCRHWRYVALSDPLLWNVTYFCGWSNWSRTSHFMHRARNASLEVHVSDSHQRGEQESISRHKMHELLLLLSRKWHQVRVATFTLHDHSTAIFLLDSLNRCARFHKSRNLEVLTLDLPAASHESYQRVSLSPGAAPNLRHLAMTGTGVDFASLPWYHKLTKLSLSHMPSHLLPTSERFLEMLSSVPCLSSLTLDRFITKTERRRFFFFEPQTTVQLLKLKTLVIGSLSGREMLSIMDHFSAPNIKHLSLCYLTEIDDGSLAEFLHGRFPHVTELFLEDFQFVHTKRARRAFVKWLVSMPEITYLKLADFPPDDLSLSWFWTVSSQPTTRTTSHFSACGPAEPTSEKSQPTRFLKYPPHSVPIGGIPTDGEAISDCLTYKAIQAETVNALAPRVDSAQAALVEPVLPQLSHVCVETISPMDIIALVNGRRNAGKPLSHLTLAHPYMLPHYLLEHIAACNTTVNIVPNHDVYSLMLDGY